MLNTNLLQQDYDYNENLIKRLEPYKDRKVGQLPGNIQKMLQQIKIGPQISGSGLESISKILTELYLANIYLEETLKDPEGSEKRYTEEIKKSEVKPTPISKTNPDETPLEIKFKPSAKIMEKPVTPSQPIMEKPKNTQTKKPDIQSIPAPNSTPPSSSQIEL